MTNYRDACREASAIEHILLEGLSHAELAKEMPMSTSAAGGRVYRARDELAAELDKRS